MKKTITANTTLTTREFIRNFSKLVKKPKSRRYTIVSHGKPVATIIPYQGNEEWWAGLKSEDYPESEEPTADSWRISLKKLQSARFNSGETDLSQRIDEIVYGIKR